MYYEHNYASISFRSMEEQVAELIEETVRLEVKWINKMNEKQKNAS